MIIYINNSYHTFWTAAACVVNRHITVVRLLLQCRIVRGSLQDTVHSNLTGPESNGLFDSGFHHLQNDVDAYRSLDQSETIANLRISVL